MSKRALKYLSKLAAAMLLVAMACFVVSWGGVNPADWMTAALAEETGDAGDTEHVVDGPTNERDGSKIESINIYWMTPDSKVNNLGQPVSQAELDDEDHLFLASRKTGLSMQYYFEVQFSGQHDYAPGEITLTIPAQVWHRRELVDGTHYVQSDRMMGSVTLPCPMAPTVGAAKFNYQYIDDKIVITNTVTISAAAKVFFDVVIGGLSAPDIIDMSECDPITVHCEVLTKEGNTIELTSKPLTAQIDTRETIAGASKGGTFYEDYADVKNMIPARLLEKLPEGTNPEDYAYVRWYVSADVSGDQPYTLTMTDTLGDCYKVIDGARSFATKGIFLGNPDGEGKEHDDSCDYAEDVIVTPTWPGNIKTITFWSAYLKADMPAPPPMGTPIRYVMYNSTKWTLTEADDKYVDTVYGKPTDEVEVTSASAGANVSYVPLQWQYPPGHFYTNKWTESRGTKNYTYVYLNRIANGNSVDMNFVLESRGFGLPWTTRDIVENANSFEEIPEEDFGVRGWRQVTEDYATYFNGESTPLTAEDYEIKSLTITMPSKLAWGRMKNGGGAFRESGDRVVAGGVEPGMFAYYYNSGLPTPDVIVEYRVEGDDTWHYAATGTWGETGKGSFRFMDDVSPEVTTSGMTVYFPKNTVNFRYTFTSNVFGGKVAEKCDIAALIWDFNTTITLKASDRVVQICKDLFEEYSEPSTIFENRDRMWVDGWILADDVEKGTHSHFDTGVDEENELHDCEYCTDLGLINRDNTFATFISTGYGVSLSKVGSWSNDKAYERFILHYTATLTESNNLPTFDEFNDALDQGAISRETEEGIWYDLLPEGVVPIMESVRLGGSDLLTSKYTIPNYKDSGRILLVVTGIMVPDAGYNTDKHYLFFDAYYTWEDWKIYGSSLRNYVAYETKLDALPSDILGTWKGQQGELDENPMGGFNYSTPNMREVIDYITDLDPSDTGEEQRFVYGAASTNVSALAYGASELAKRVKNDLDGMWTTGLKGNHQVTVYEGHNYTYRLGVSSSRDTVTKEMIIYDTIENYHIPAPGDEHHDATKLDDYNDKESKKNWQGDWEGKGTWRGALTSVDLTNYIKMGVAPVLYYSTIPDLTFEDSNPEAGLSHEEKLAIFTSGNYDISDGSIWTRATLTDGIWTVPDELAGKVTAVALDARKGQDGNDFVLEPEKKIEALLHMVAPDDDSDPDVWHAKGAYAHVTDELGFPTQEIDWEKASAGPENNMYAYNNTRMRCVQESTTNDAISSAIQIRYDYTRVGILPMVLHVEKQWDDQNNHDNIRPESVTVTLMRKLTGTTDEPVYVLDKDGEKITAVLSEENGWRATFLQMDIVNEEGVLYQYSFEENEVPGYTQKAALMKDETHYAVVNSHPNDQVPISGKKVWLDDDDNLGNTRPDFIKVTLLCNGQEIKKLTVKPDENGNWSYDFGNQDKFAYGGELNEYTVVEEPVSRYIASYDGYKVINNKYYPYGDLSIEKIVENATPVCLEQNVFKFMLHLEKEQTQAQIDAGEVPEPVYGKFEYDVFEKQEDGTWKQLTEKSGAIGDSMILELKGNEKAVIHDIPDGTRYSLVEDGVEGFTQTGAENATGTIKSNIVPEAKFTNTYSASGKVQLKAFKTIKGHAMRKNQFRFQIKDITEDSETYNTVLSTVGNGNTTNSQEAIGEPIVGSAPVSFGQIRYTEADHGKVFLYEVSEVDLEKPGYIYDETKYVAKVSVTDNGDGTMTVTAVDAETGVDLLDPANDKFYTFDNEYKAESQIALKGWKTITVRELKDKEFRFELYEYDRNTGMKVGAPLQTRVTNNADGEIIFEPLVFNQDDVNIDENHPAQYSYLVRETVGSDKTVNYDEREFIVNVQVQDNGDGTLAFTLDNQVGVRTLVPCEEPAVGDPKPDQRTMATIYYKQVMPLVEADIDDGFAMDDSWRLLYGKDKNDITTGRYILSTLCTVCKGSHKVHGKVCEYCKGSGLESGADVKPSANWDGTFVKYVHLNGEENGEAYALYYYNHDDLTGYALMRTDKIELVSSTCPNCNGNGWKEGPVQVTGDASLIVFNNTLKDGSLKVEKRISGTSRLQKFTFHVRLTGENVPTKLEVNNPTPAATAVTPTPSPTPAGTARRGQTPTPAPTPQPTPIVTPYKVAEEDKAPASSTLMMYINPYVGSTMYWPSSGFDEKYKAIMFHADDLNNVRCPVCGAYCYRANDVEWRCTGTCEASSTFGSGDYASRDNRAKIYEISYVETGDLDHYEAVRRDYPWISSTFSGTNARALYWYDSFEMRDPVVAKTTKELFFEMGVFGDTFDISKLDTSECTNFERMFYGTKPGEDEILDLRTFDTSKGETFEYMFSSGHIKELDVSGFDISSTTSLKNMFSGLSNVTTLDLRSFGDISHITDISGMFNGCAELSDFDVLRYWDTSNVTDMSHLFQGTRYVNTHGDTSKWSFLRTIEEWDTSKVEDMSYMFNNTSAHVLDLRDWDTSSVKKMEYMFSGYNDYMAGFYWINDWDVSNVESMKGMFSSSNLSPTVTNWDTSKVTDFSYMFTDNTASVLDLTGMDTQNGNNFNFIFYHSNRDKLILSGWEFGKDNGYPKADWFYQTSLSYKENTMKLMTYLDISDLTFPEADDPHDYYDTSSVFDSDRPTVYQFIQFIKVGDDFASNLPEDRVKYWDMPMTLDYTRLGSVYSRASSLPMTKMYINLDNPDEVLDIKTILTEPGHAGTWGSFVPRYELELDANGGMFNVSNIKVDYFDAIKSGSYSTTSGDTGYSGFGNMYGGYTITGPTGMAYKAVKIDGGRVGYNLVGFTDEEGLYYPVREDGYMYVPLPTNSQIANKQFSFDEKRKLTAVWEEQTNNVQMEDGVFTFEVYGGHSITFNNVPAGLAYEVWEDTPSGWVLVKKTNESGIIQPITTSTATFENEYTPSSTRVYLQARKTLDNSAVKEEKKFFFKLIDADNDTEIQTNIGNKAGGLVSFNSISYSRYSMGGEDEKVFNYTIKEQIADDADSTIIYDERSYDVKVTVKDDAQGNLSAVVEYADGDVPTFENKTKPGKLAITKVLEGTLTEKAMEQEFDVTVTFTDKLMQPWAFEGGVVTLDNGEELTVSNEGKVTVTLKGGETVTIVDLPADVRYMVNESGELAGWTMDETDYIGLIKADETSEVEVTNSYAATGTAQLQAEKVMKERAPKNAEFTFILTDAEGNEEQATNQMTTDEEDPVSLVTFKPITYTEEGTYTYTITEVPGDDPTIVYSNEVIEATVVVTDVDGKGVLTTEVTYKNGEKENDNTITNQMQSGALEVNKRVVNGIEANKDKEFTFTLKLTDAKNLLVNGMYDLTIDGETTDLKVSGGLTQFKLKGGQTALIEGLPHGATYALIEANEPGFTQSSTFDTNTISAAETAHANFVNTYTSSGECTITLTKVLEGADLEEGQFQFVLMNAEGKELETVTNDADGKAAFETLFFTDADAGETLYMVKEKNLGAVGYTYDETLYQVIITVEDDGEGNMEATLEYLADDEPADEIIFRNTYSNTTSVTATKVWRNDEEFIEKRPDIVLKLYANYLGGTKELAGEKTIAADAEDDELTVTWDELPRFDKNGAMIVYTVDEEAVEGGEEQLSFYVAIVSGSADTGYTLVNRLVYEELDLKARKLVDGEPATEDQVFTFMLKDEEGNVLETVQNHGEEITFSTLKYNRGEFGKTHKYTITEADVDYVTIDESEYMVTVELADGNDAEMTVEITKNGEPCEEIVFDNTSKEIDVKVEKVWQDDKNAYGLRPEGIKVDLLADGKTISTVELNEKNDWTVTFTGLPVYQGGEKAVEYTIKEAEVENYATEVTGSAEEGFVLTNKLLLTTTQIEAFKELDGAALKANQFTFQLKENDKVLQTAKNNAAGKIAFKEVEWKLADIGAHKLTISEVNDRQANVTYDKTVFTVTVEVQLDEDGMLTSKITDISSGAGKTGLEKVRFVNNYKEEEKYDIAFTFAKKWNDDGSERPTPKFVLYNAEGKVVRAANQPPRKNGDNTYTYWLSKPGDYYVVEEKMEGYVAVYQNFGAHAAATDRVYNGGTITNTKVPDTGDHGHVELYAALAAIGLMLILAALLPNRKKHSK